MKKILRDNKGSISALVVISVLLYSIVLTTAYMKASGKRRIQIQSQTLAKETYEKQLDNLDEIRDEINGGAGGGGAGTKVPAEATAETAPYFPDNTFTKKEGTIDTGLVIQDASGNEYVWVVVPRTTAVYKTTGLGKTTFSDADYTNIETDLKNYTSTYVTEEGYSDTHADDTANVGWLTSGEYTELKNSMLKSVYENGGFYVGRYEAGIDTTTGTNRTSNTDQNSEGKYITPSTAPVTKADAYPYTYVTRTQAQNLASNVNSGTKTSSLLFGVQWDLVLAFMSKDTAKITSTDFLTSNSTTIGNHYNSTFQLSQTGKYATMSDWTSSSTWNPSTTATTNFVDSSRNKIAQSSDDNGILVTTGTSEKNKVMNIYDVAGNVEEWTLEKISDTNSPCVSRGGNFSRSGSNGPAASRDDYFTDDSYGNIGFRVSLF